MTIITMSLDCVMDFLADSSLNVCKGKYCRNAKCCNECFRMYTAVKQLVKAYCCDMSRCVFWMGLKPKIFRLLKLVLGREN